MRICKMYGQMTVVGEDGTKVIWFWDYHLDLPVLQKDFTPERRKLSDKAKRLQLAKKRRK